MPLLSCLSSLDVMIDTIIMEKRIGKKKREKRSPMRHIFGGCIILPLSPSPVKTPQKSLTTTTTTTRVRIVDIQQQQIIIIIMGKNVRKTKKFALTKRLLNPKDAKQQSRNDGTKKAPLKNQFKTKENELKIKRIEAVTSNMFNEHNAAIKPPYSVLVDTNFINFSIKNKIDLVKGMMDCLYANCVPHVTDCVIGELEKLGTKFRVALRVAKDPRFVKLPCMHKGTYADDCIVDRCRKHRCYVVATCDTDLKRRLRKIPGVPIMYLQNHKYSVERLPAAGNIGNAPRL